MNLNEQAKIIVQQSTLLSSLEKTEWLQLLVAMNEEQVAELIEILKPGAAVEMLQNAPVIPEAPKIVPEAPKPVFKPQLVDIKEKEIGTSKPLYELEIPEHATVAKMSEPIIPKEQTVVVSKAPVVPAPADPTALQQRVESIVKEMQNKNAPVKPSMPVAPAPVLKSQVKPVIAPKPKTQPEPLQLKSLEDFKKLTPAHLHGDNASEDLQNIVLSISALSSRYKPFDLVAAIEESSLYKTYLEIGTALLNDSNPDRDSAYAKVLKDMDVKGQDFLTKDEF
jgi:hypothetical protein